MALTEPNQDGTQRAIDRSTSVPGVFSAVGSRRGSHQLLHVSGPASAKDSCKTSLTHLLTGSANFDDPSKLASQNPKPDTKITPRRLPRTNIKGLLRKELLDRQSQHPHHSFLTDITDVRQMEQGLLQLLDDFHSGKLQAFGKECTLEKMENVREQQERLARLHFDLNAKQEMLGPQSDEGRKMAKENLSKLIENLQQLSNSIEQLQSGSPGLQTDV